MSGPPEVAIVKGAPSPAEARAVEAAVTALWREQIAAAAKSEGMNPWILAARAAATRSGTSATKGRTHDAWRVASRLSAPGPSPIQPGRGDAR